LKYAKKIQQNEKKLMKYKKNQNNPKFEQGVSNNVGSIHKKLRQKNKKNNPQVPGTPTLGANRAAHIANRDPFTLVGPIKTLNI
jgi:hypothetical protein